MERGSVAASSINRPGGTLWTMRPSSSCFTVKMSDCQVVRGDHVACNNNISKNSATSAPQVRPSDEDNSYAMAIRNSSPIAPDPAAASATFSDSCDDDVEGDDEEEEVTDQEPFEGETADDGEAGDAYCFRNSYSSPGYY